MKYKHRMVYEFRKGRFPRGWRGDSWCKNCNYMIYSREAKRMEMFGLAETEPSSMGNGDEIYVVKNIKVL